MNIFRRVWDSFGFEDRYDENEYDYEYEEEDGSAYYSSETMDAMQQPVMPPNNVVGMPNRKMAHTEMYLMEPRSFEEMPQAVTALRERRSIILNLSLMDADAAQRCVDFVAGAAFAIDGHQERIGEHIFLFTPSFVQISSYPTIAQAAPQRAPMPPTHITPPAPAWGNMTQMSQ
ncbi:cell division protein SepF [Stenomitos frigidus]|uniref:Cell division protein SepF n=1 Tax=Stenomitos frigidus ULC18 TaxID=2107698 RepID=A0A2T1DSX5_9CYAN|nr:cell division protein SepF [Stenomitos frigidus]PSB23575.1 cell division protein SepF [Stenomitos frigidus ULC18]